MNIAIDIGNTRVKVGLFRAGELKKVLFLAHAHFAEDLWKHLAEEDLLEEVQYLACAIVGNRDMLQAVADLAARLPQADYLEIGPDTRLPVQNGYATPRTLGMDRICACAGAYERTGKAPLLVIDAGTAITYDYLDAQAVYQGGGIAPGMRLRFRSLHNHTATLPLVEAEGDLPLVGYSTETSIRSGVVNGLLAEIDGIVERYQNFAGTPCQIFLTGGDANFLGNRLKNINFVDSNLLLFGIHAVLTYNLPHAP